MKPVDVTVICSVKNGEKTIGTTISSIIDQSFQNWEFIIVDDGSTDKTIEIINEYVRKDSRINLIVSGGIGRGRALNLAIKNSKGRYIANIDADDPSHPQRLEYQYRIMEKDSSFSVLCTNYKLLSNYESFIWKEYDNCELKLQDISRKIFTNNPIIHSSVLIRKEDIYDIGLYDGNRSSLFDYDLWLKFVKKSYKLGYIDAVLASKRFHDNQSYENKKRLKYLKDILYLQNKTLKEIEGNKFEYICIYLKFLYGLLPQNIRKAVIKAKLIYKS